MSTNFKIPPITIEMVAQVERIGELLGQLSVSRMEPTAPQLRRQSQVNSIQASLQIEGNSLTVEQVTAVLDGKPVLASPRDVQEVRNALQAYDQMSQWDPYSLDDLCAAHGVLMRGLVDQPGEFRRRAVGIQRGGEVIHVAPPAHLVPELMRELFSFLEAARVSPLIGSCMFHYEFEFIHPFSDGNGRLGRLWQTLLLSRWNPIFAVLPVESMVRDHQADYYAALNRSNQEVHSGSFTAFMLAMILGLLERAKTPGASPVTPPVKVWLRLLAKRGELGVKEALTALSLKDRRRFREAYVTPALRAGLIEYVFPDAPTSRHQRYRLTAAGRAEC